MTSLAIDFPIVGQCISCVKVGKTRKSYNVFVMNFHCGPMDFLSEVWQNKKILQYFFESQSQNVMNFYCVPMDFLC